MTEINPHSQMTTLSTAGLPPMADVPFAAIKPIAAVAITPTHITADLSLFMLALSFLQNFFYFLDVLTSFYPELYPRAGANGI